MPTLNFNRQFATKVELRLKQISFRPVRKFPIYPNDKLYLYTGLRTAKARKLGEAVVTYASPASIDADSMMITHGDPTKDPRAFSELIIGFSLELWAKADGFENWQEMVAWFEELYDLPWKGTLIQWEFKS